MAGFIEDFCTTTTFHGYADWYSSRKLFWKSVWMVTIAASIAASIYETSEIIKQYYAAPVTTNIEIHSVENFDMKFPDITICSKSFINPNLVEQLDLDDFIEEIGFEQNSQLDLLLGIALNNRTQKHSHIQEITLNLRTENDIEHIIKVYENITYKTEEIIKSCLFADKPCNKSGVFIKRVFEAYFGICLLMNVTDKQKFGDNGLTLLIDTHASSLLKADPVFDEGISFRVQNAYDPLEPCDYQVATASQNKMSLRATHFSLVKYGNNCQTNKITKFLTGIPYTQNLCQVECRYSVIHAKCKCLPVVYRSNFVNKLTEVCRTPDQLLCIKNATSLDSTSYAKCVSDCRPPCEYWMYSTTVSQKRFPAKQTRPIVALALGVNDSRIDDMLVMEFSMDQIQVTNVQQQFSITLDGFVSQIGGLMGLFMGGSLVSVVHIFVVLLQHCRKPLTKRISDNKK